MNRREVFKVAGITAIAALTVNAQASEKIDNEKNRLIMKPKDASNMTKGELKHTPEITIKDKDAKGYTSVEINIGQAGIVHPSTPDHWIDYISLYSDDKLIGKSVLEAEISRGTASFSVKLDSVKTLKAESGCNLHGIWSSSIKV